MVALDFLYFLLLFWLFVLVFAFFTAIILAVIDIYQMASGKMFDKFEL